MKLLARFRKAAALPFVLLLVALNVIVVVALMVYATTELQASRNSGQAEVARAIAQSGIDIAAGLIAANSTNNGFVSYQRVTNVGGNYRLETKIANVTADSSTPWKTYVTNPSVLHSGFLSGTDGVDLNFAVGGDPTAGFIAPRTNIITPGTNTSVWTNLSTNMFRMDWIYIYKGPTNDSKNLIGRVAYWVDDESSKLNVNYSGAAIEYTLYNTYFSYQEQAGKWTDFSIKRPNLTNSPNQKNFAGRKWPVYMELGGVAGINTNEAFAILAYRGDPNPTNSKNYPSVLAMRIATNSVLPTLPQQSSVGFTATIYSKEDERSYATGKQRYDLLRFYPNATTNTINEFLTAISDNYPGTNSYPSFNNKYDMNSFAATLYTAVQYPGLPNMAGLEPARAMPASVIYSRALPLLNEVTLRAEVVNDSGTGTNYFPPGTNTVRFYTDIELIVLSTVQNTPWHYDWGATLTDTSKFKVEVELSTNSVFSTVFTNQFTNTITMTPTTNNWFKYPIYGTNGVISYYTNGICFGPTNSTFSTNNAIAVLSATNARTNYNTNTEWSYPTNVTVKIYFNSVLYQSISFAPAVTANTTYTPITNMTNTIYHMVAQPRGDLGFRGDPRFWTYTNNFFTNSVVSGPMTNSTNNPDTSLGIANPKWNISGYTNATNSPDLTPPDLYFYEQDRGIPQHAGDKAWGFGPSLAGVGWIGEIPITTKTGEILTWSTPRLWGDGRELVNGTKYPPDWLLMDCVHMSAFPQVPQFTGSTNLVYSSFGKININTLKSFFQVARGSPNQSDTILDSVTVDSKTVDFRQGSGSGAGLFYNSAWTRTGFNSGVTNMIVNQNASDNPYTTHFGFLAALITNTMPSIPYHPSSGWWPAPIPTNTGASIYTATNTTDRRIEGIVRSLVHKLTTHGNQFSIFSLGQALKVVNEKTNVVGEAYLQSVYERAPLYDETTGAITNGSSGAPPMRQLYLRELRY